MPKEHFPYDRTLRELFQSIPKRFTEVIMGKRVTRVLDPSFPSVKERKADFLGVLEDGDLVHIEIQLQHDLSLPERMIEILLMVKWSYGRVPNQLVLWIGEGESPYGEEYRIGGVSYRMKVVDIKEIDCGVLMDSDDPNDNLLAVLCRRGEGFWEVLSERVKRMPIRKREVFVRRLLYLVKLRGDLMREYELLRKEVTAMPIVIELEKDPAYVKGIEKGIERGIEKGLILDAQELLIEALEIKFGAVVETLKKQIKAIEDRDLLRRLHRAAIKANSLDEVIREF